MGSCKSQQDMDLLKTRILYPIIDEIMEIAPQVREAVGSGSYTEYPYNLLKRNIEKYEDIAINSMKSKNGIDRHKQAACLMIAIALSGILDNGGTVSLNGKSKKIVLANEELAVRAALTSIKAEMIKDCCGKWNVPFAEKQNAINYYFMKFPKEIISDENSYVMNMLIALNNLVIRMRNNASKFKVSEDGWFDIWAYSDRFYLLELYNIVELRRFFEERGIVIP